MFFSTVFFASLATSAVAAKTSRTFAVNYFYGPDALVTARMDPIVSPGKASGHVHVIQGGSNFALTLSDTELLNSQCTSSLVKNDKSNYWTPSLYFQDPKNGSFISVPMFYMKAYYFFEATDDKIVAFQPGHRMVSGNAELRTPPASGGASILDLNAGTPQPVQWTCPRTNFNPPNYPANSDGLDGVGIQDPGNQGAGVGFPDVNCDGYASPLRADIHFPSCYNPQAGLDNYKNNMQFPSSAGTTGGKANCPSGWIHTPHLFYEVYWNTPLFASLWTPGQGKQPFVLANGDNTGYSLHADFISGWDVQTLQQIIDNCDSGNNGMNKCPGLIGGVNNPSASCTIPSAISENVSGVLEALPGNNPVTGWGVGGAAAAPANSASSSDTVSSSAPASSASSPASSPAKYTTGYSSTPSSSSSSSKSTTFSTITTHAISSTSPSTSPTSTATDDDNNDTATATGIAAAPTTTTSASPFPALPSPASGDSGTSHSAVSACSITTVTVTSHYASTVTVTATAT